MIKETAVYCWGKYFYAALRNDIVVKITHLQVIS